MLPQNTNRNRVIAVHDISCVGRCSLTVALPILSAAGIETSVIPTAVLSTHTGEFSGYTFRDLTDDIAPIGEHWKSLGLGAKAIYTGYLGSYHQLEIVKQLISDFKSDDTFVLVDPVMGDAGKLYSRIDEKFVSGMKKLCSMADMIVPNITEAAMLTDSEYIAHGYDENYIKDLLKKLSLLGPRYSILSGVSFEEGKHGSAAYDSEKDEFSFFFSEHIDGFYYGTGDIFASAILGATLNGKTVSEAIKIAVDLTIGAIKRTHEAKTDKRYGVLFEKELPSYIKALGLI